MSTLMFLVSHGSFGVGGVGCCDFPYLEHFGNVEGCGEGWALRRRREGGLEGHWDGAITTELGAFRPETIGK